MPKFPNKTQKKEMQTFMTKTHYEGCYARLHDFLERKYPKKKVSDLITWAVNARLDDLTLDKKTFLQ
jgi:predicted lipid carrier protein YhbT